MYCVRSSRVLDKPDLVNSNLNDVTNEVIKNALKTLTSDEEVSQYSRTSENTICLDLGDKILNSH